MSIPVVEIQRCEECGDVLSPEEVTYYENQCNGCQQEWQFRIEAWRKGEPDQELDRLYSTGQPPIATRH